MRDRDHHIGHVLPAADDEIGLGHLGQRLRHVRLPGHDGVDLAFFQRRRQAELRPDVLDGDVIVLHPGAAKHHLEIFVGRLAARETDGLALEIADLADIDAPALLGDDGERRIAMIVGGVVHDQADDLERVAGVHGL